MLTDGTASLLVASHAGLTKLPADTHKTKLVDWRSAAIDLRMEGLLMAPTFAIPRLLARHGLTYADIDIWEIHGAPLPYAAGVCPRITACTGIWLATHS